MKRGEATLNRVVNAALGKFCRNADCILDGVGIRRSVSDNADALYAEQRSATVFGVVEALLEIGEGAAREQGSDLARDGGLQRFLQRGAHEIGDAFGNFQGDIADESVSDDDVHFAVVKVAAF